MAFQASYFMSGVVCGVITFVVLFSIYPGVLDRSISFEIKHDDQDIEYIRILEIKMDPRRAKMQLLESEKQPNRAIMSEQKYHNDNTSVALQLKSSVRVFCAIFTHYNYISSYAKSVNNTWAHRCTKTIYFSNKGNSTFGLPLVYLEDSDVPKFFIKRMIVALTHVYIKHFHDAEWFVFSSDTSFVIMENLRYFLSDKNPEQPIIFGPPKEKSTFDFHSTMTVMSKKALFFEAAGDLEQCYKSRQVPTGPTFDIYLDLCMVDSGIENGVTEDEEGNELFNIHDPITSNSLNCSFVNNKLSDHTISFRDIHPRSMYRLAYFIYHLRPHGILNLYSKTTV